MVGETHGQHLSLRVQDMDTPNADGFNNSISYSLRTGINKIVFGEERVNLCDVSCQW